MFYRLLDLRSSECDVVSLYVVCCVFDSVCELFGETIRNVFGCSCYYFILLVNVMEVFSVCDGALLIRPCMVFQRVCVCCACNPNERLSGPSICFVCVFVCRKVSPHLGV